VPWKYDPGDRRRKHKWDNDYAGLEVEGGVDIGKVAIAAELLLTRNAALMAYLKLKDVEQALEAIAKNYNVSFEVAAWQLLNSRAELSAGQRQLLLKHSYRYGA
jgi:hypothetical protein